MPDPSATSMVQTPDEYLWVGTFNGLARFDGVRFTVYDPSNTPELPSHGVVNLYLDSRGGLWVSTLKGLVRQMGGKWQNFMGAGGWTGDFVRSFSENADVLVMTSFDGKVFRFTDGRMEALPPPPGESGRGYLGYVDEMGKIWVVQHRFFGWWDGEGWHRDETLADLLGEGINAAPANDGGLWIVRGRNLCKFKSGSLRERRQLTQAIVEPWTLAEDREGELWVPSLDRGLYRIKADGQVISYTTENGLSYNGLRFMFQDHEGNHWVGSSGGGLMRFKRRTFISFGEESGLQQRVVKSVAEEPAGNILVGTYGRGVARLVEGNFVRAWPNQPAYPQCVLVDRQGRTWVGTFGGGLFIFQTNQPSALATNQSAGQNITALFQDAHGKIWVGGSDAVEVYSGQASLDLLPQQRFKLHGVVCFEEDPDRQCIWAGSDEGLFRIDGQKIVEQYNAVGHSIPEVTTIYAHRGGALWIGARSGLLRLRDRQWTAFTTDDGFPVPTVTCLLPDDHGYLWLGSHVGVARASIKELEAFQPRSSRPPVFQIFNGSDGMASIDCPAGFQPTAVRDHQGRLWFATLKGISMVDPQKLQLNTNPPSVFIDQVRIEEFSKKQSYLWPTASRPVVLPPGLGEIAVFFGALSYAAPEKVRFAYRIENLNNNWIDIGNRRTLYFFPPPPGTYKLRIKAANNDGIWNDEGTALAFTVLPFYWQTVWFRVLVVFGAAGIAGGLVWRVLSSKIRNQKELLVQEARFRQLAAAAWEGIAVTEGGKFVDVNDQLAAMLGGAPVDLIGRSVTDVVAPESREQVLTAIRANEEGPYEHLALRLDGTSFPIEVRARKAQVGERVLRISAVRDVTERRQAERALRELARRLMRVQDQEQRRIGRELHDSTGQTLAALEITLAMANKRTHQLPPAVREKLAECAALASQCTAQIRTASYLLHPPLLEELGLASALRWLVDGFSQRSGIEVTLDLAETLPRLDEEYELTLFRVVQEALTNVHRHSGSPRAHVRLRAYQAHLELEVVDDGHGIVADQLGDLESGRKTLGVGISGMRERLRQLGGELKIQSSSAGTGVYVMLPLPRHQKQG